MSIATAAICASVGLVGCSSGGAVSNRPPSVVGEGPVTLAVRVTDSTRMTLRLDWTDDNGLTRSRSFTTRRRDPVDLLAEETPFYDITLAAPCCPEPQDDDEPTARERPPRILGAGPTTLAFGIDAGAPLKVRVVWTLEDGSDRNRAFRVTETRSVHFSLEPAERYEIRVRSDCD